MRIGLVVDFGCDFFKFFIDEYGILIFLVFIWFGDQIIVDEWDLECICQFYVIEVFEKVYGVEFILFIMEQIKVLFFDKVVVDFDYVLVQMVLKSCSLIFINVIEVFYVILCEYKLIWKQVGVEGFFVLCVIDSQILFVGQGVLVVEIMCLI